MLSKTKKLGKPTTNSIDSLQSQNFSSRSGLSNTSPPLPHPPPATHSVSSVYTPSFHSFNHNNLPIHIAGQKFTATIDTGADNSFMNAEILKQLPSFIQQKIKPTFRKCRCANNEVVQVQGSISLHFTMNGYKFRENFLIIKNASNDLFLGLTFLQRHKAQLDFSSNSMSLNAAVSVHSATALTIDPYSEILCHGELAYAIPDQSVGICHPHQKAPNGRPSCLLTAYSAVTAYGNIIPVRLYNSSNQPYRLNKGSIIAQFYLTQADGENQTSINGRFDDNHFNDVTTDANAAQSINAFHSKNEAQSFSTLQSESERELMQSLNLDNSVLDENQKHSLRQLVSKYTDCFANKKITNWV